MPRCCPLGRSRNANPSSIVMPRRFSSFNRSVLMPVSALISAVLQWSMCQAVPRMICFNDYSLLDWIRFEKAKILDKINKIFRIIFCPAKRRIASSHFYEENGIKNIFNIRLILSKKYVYKNYFFLFFLKYSITYAIPTRKTASPAT